MKQKESFMFLKTKKEVQAAQKPQIFLSKENGRLIISAEDMAVWLASHSAEQLVSQLGNVNIRNKNNETPLHLILHYPPNATVENVLPLMNAGADLNAKDASGKTPLNILLRYNYNYMNLEFLNLLLLFIENGADVNTQDSGGNTLLMELTDCKNINEWDIHNCRSGFCLAKDLFRPNTTFSLAAHILLDAGADADRQNNEGDTVLIKLIRNKHFDENFIAYLAGKSNLNIRNGKGETALSLALQSKNYGVARILVDKGADFNEVIDDNFCRLNQIYEAARKYMLNHIRGSVKNLIPASRKKEYIARLKQNNFYKILRHGPAVPDKSSAEGKVREN